MKIDTTKGIVPKVSSEMFGMNAYPDTMPRESEDSRGYGIYKTLVSQSGVRSLKIPGDAYHNRYDWMSGAFSSYGNSGTGWTLADWKKFSDDTGVSIFGVIDPYLYFTDHGNGVIDARGRPPGGKDPAAMIRWAKAQNWDPAKWNRWIIGVETYGSWDESYVDDPNLYAQMVNEIVPKMKAEAPDLKIGIVCEVVWKPAWCGTVLQQAEANIDFVNFHWYPHDGWTVPEGTMQHYPWLKASLLPKFDNLFSNYVGGRRKPIIIGEYDFWRMDGYGPVLRRNSSLATALAWGDFIGVSTGLGISGAWGYDFVSGSSYGQLLSWNEQSFRPIKYRPTTFVMGMWSRFSGSSMIETSVTGSSSYIFPTEGRQDWANVDSGGYTAIPVDHVTAYAGLDSVANKLSIILINKHATNSFDLSISTIGRSVAPLTVATIQTLTTSDPNLLLASNRQYDSTPMEVPPPTESSMMVGDVFNLNLGPHSMVSLEFSVASDGSPGPTPTPVPTAVPNLQGDPSTDVPAPDGDADTTGSNSLTIGTQTGCATGATSTNGFGTAVSLLLSFAVLLYRRARQERLMRLRSR